MKSLRIESVFNHTSGYGSVARSFATELQKQQRENIDLKLYNITQNFRSQEEKQFSYLWDDAKMVPLFQKDLHADVSLLWSSPEEILTIAKDGKIRYNENTVKHNYVAWELDKIPNLWASMLQDYKSDLILTPSIYSKNSITNMIDDIPVEVVPHGYDPKVFFKKDKTKKRKSFVVLYNGTWIKRKGTLESILATINALRGTNSEIWINIHYNDAIVKNIKRTLQTSVARSFYTNFDNKNLPKIFIFNKYLSEKEMNVMYNKADIVISGSRGEGFNMPVLESIATKTPVIVTNQGGHMDFVKSNYKFLVKTNGLVYSSGDGFYDTKLGLKWLDVDYSHMSDLILDAYNMWADDKTKLESLGQDLYENIKGLTWSNAVDTYLNYAELY